jgi:small basic protein
VLLEERRIGVFAESAPRGRKTKGWHAENKRRHACEQEKWKGTQTRVFAKSASGRYMPINIYACRSAFFPGCVFKLAKCSQNWRAAVVVCRFCQSIFTRAAPLLFLGVRLGWLICCGACGVGNVIWFRCFLSAIGRARSWVVVCNRICFM